MAPLPPHLLFIPGLHKFTAGPGPRPSQPAPSPRSFCPSTSRHALVTPPSPSLSGSARHPNPPRGRRVAPQAVVAPAPPSPAARSTLQPPAPMLPSSTSRLPAPAPPPEPPATRVAGHKHTAESKRKISAANRGNVPWNKGRRHTEETKRKISEATRRAMLQPEMRRLLKERARGRKHSEATKLKIRETARATRGAGSSAKKSKKRPVPFTFPPEVVADLNGKVQRQLETTYRMGETQRLIVREKRVMPDETKAKLSARIKELWNDPEYRTKVADGIEQRAQRLGREKSSSPSSNHGATPTDLSGSTKVKSEPTPARAGKSPRRRARSKSSSARRSNEDLEHEAYDEIDASEIFLHPESLGGITKEDLGLYDDAQEEGRIDTGSSTNNAIMTDRDGDGDKQSHSPPDDVLREHNALLASLVTAGQTEQLGGSDYIEMSSNHEGLGDLNTEFHAAHADPLDPVHAGTSSQEFDREMAVSGYRQDPAQPEVLGFFDNSPVPMSSSATAPSPFVSVGSVAEEDRITPEVNSAFDFSSGGEHLLGQNSNSGYVQDRLPLNYVGDNLSGLDICDEDGTPLDNAMKTSPSVDLDRRSGQFANNSAKYGM